MRRSHRILPRHRQLVQLQPNPRCQSQGATQTADERTCSRPWHSHTTSPVQSVHDSMESRTLWPAIGDRRSDTHPWPGLRTSAVANEAGDDLSSCHNRQSLSTTICHRILKDNSQQHDANAVYTRFAARLCCSHRSATWKPAHCRTRNVPNSSTTPQRPSTKASVMTP